ncbi:MAG: hypothetical protein N2C14_22740 [Planctomycetales bacterium]
MDAALDAAAGTSLSAAADPDRLAYFFDRLAYFTARSPMDV